MAEGCVSHSSVAGGASWRGFGSRGIVTTNHERLWRRHEAHTRGWSGCRSVQTTPCDHVEVRTRREGDDGDAGKGREGETREGRRIERGRVVVSAANERTMAVWDRVQARDRS